jgi:ABC-type transporter MlaC component
MRTFPFITLLCVSLLLPLALAQEPTPEQVQQQIEEQLQRLQSPRQQIHWETDQLAVIRSAWNGQGTMIPLTIMLHFGNETELGLTEEQKQRLAPFYRGY